MLIATMLVAKRAASRPKNACMSCHSLAGFRGLRTSQVITPSALDHLIQPGYFTWEIFRPRLVAENV
jgi:hypothetical protein